MRISPKDGHLSERRFLSAVDWPFVVAVAALIGVGLVSVYSATYSMGGRHVLFVKQAWFLGVGFCVMVGTLFFDYHAFERWGYALYGLMVLMLVAVLAAGRTGMGAQRWVALGPLSFQPSELAKVILIITLAKYYSGDGVTDGGHTLGQLVKPLMLLLVPMALVIKQPDLGTALMLLFIFCAMTALAGVRLRSFVKLLIGAALVAPVAWGFFWGHLKDYQKQRILTFMSPESDPSGSGYHVIQSKIAIGSGALTGKGYLNGTQSQLSFLPERHTDFIFSVISEEWGFLGSMLVLLLFLFIILWGIETSYKAKDRFGALLAAGITSMLSFYVVINVGMTLGIMPVVGVPLPLISYGGTSALTTLFALGLLLNINMRRYSLFY